jgi:hypothetical protein
MAWRTGGLIENLWSKFAHKGLTVLIVLQEAAILQLTCKN